MAWPCLRGPPGVHTQDAGVGRQSLCSAIVATGEHDREIPSPAAFGSSQPIPRTQLVANLDEIGEFPIGIDHDDDHTLLGKLLGGESVLTGINPADNTDSDPLAGGGAGDSALRLIILSISPGRRIGHGHDGGCMLDDSSALAKPITSRSAHSKLTTSTTWG